MAKRKTHIMSDETGQRMARALEVIAGSTALEWDQTEGEYTNASIASMLSARADGLSYGVLVPKGSATACTKTGANAGVAAPVPGIVGRPCIDPYVGLGPFFFMEVNGYVDEDGTPHVTAVNGDGAFRRDGSNGDVWILAPVLYWAYTDTDSGIQISVCDRKAPGMSLQPGALLPDGSQRPYMLYAKYALSIVDGTARSVSGKKPQTRNVSHNSLITQCKTATTGYSGKSYADDWYMKVMILLKYATKNSQSVMAGCTSYTTQVAPSVAETGTTRVIIPKAQADGLLVGSAMMLGTHTSTSNDRGTGYNYDVFDGLKIVRIEAYDASNSAVYFDTDETFDTATTYLLSTAPWPTGACDLVEGDGSPTSPTSGKEPFAIQGIEVGLGMYEALGDVMLKSDGSTGWRIYVNRDSRKEATSITSDYTDTGKFTPATGGEGWKYPLYPDLAGGLLYGNGGGASTTTGMCDGSYCSAVTATGEREWLSLGVLVVGANAGVWCVFGSSGTGSAWWYVGSRLSATGRTKG